MRYDEPRQVRIPVRVINGAITFFYSGVPFRMREGAIGDLIVDEEEVGSRLRSLLQRQSAVTMFEAGTTLWVNVQPDPSWPLPAAIGELLQSHKGAKPLVPGPFAPVYLREPLRLHLRGTKLGELLSCSIVAPWLGNDNDTSLHVSSLNQAYTRISQICEPQRKSHTGNVFEKVFFLSEKSKRLWPLADRRGQLEAGAESELAVLSATWWLEDAYGLPRCWAHVGQDGVDVWIVSIIDEASFVLRQDSFRHESEAVFFLQNEGFLCLPFEPTDRADWPPEPPYRRFNGEEAVLPWQWPLKNTINSFHV